jgi:hypothetical protein
MRRDQPRTERAPYPFQPVNTGGAMPRPFFPAF